MIGAALFEGSQSDGVAFVLDLTEQKRAQERLEEARKALYTTQEENRASQARQVAVRADVSLAFGRQSNLEEILHECAESMVRHLDAAFARIWTLSHNGKMLELRASAGLYTQLNGAHSRVPMGHLKIGMIALEQKPAVANDLINDPRISDKLWVAKEGMESFAGYPLVVGTRTLGVMAMFSRKPLTTGTVETLASIADLIAQGIERKHAEDELRASERSLRELTETIPQMLWSAEASTGSIEYCNQHALDYTGLSLEQARGTGWMKIVHPDDIATVSRVWTSAVSSGEAYDLEFRCLRASDHVYRWCVSKAVPLRDHTGRILRWFGTLVDLHDWREAQQALYTTQGELARIARLTTMGELAASIAHEVNQPLTAVTNNASACMRLMANRSLDPEVLKRVLEEIVADAARASAVITRIRGFIKKTPIDKRELDMNDVIQEVLALAGHELQQNQVFVDCHLSETLPQVRADRVQLQQVLLNLVMNGVEAMTGAQRRTLSLDSRTDESGNVLVAVRDSGTGFGSEGDHLFTPFFTTKGNGMGMGLPISRSLIESHGGHLWATANSPHGAVFCFTLPAASESDS
jgi:PAS domain S-box-containing protein